MVTVSRHSPPRLGLLRRVRLHEHLNSKIVRVLFLTSGTREFRIHVIFMPIHPSAFIPGACCNLQYLHFCILARLRIFFSTFTCLTATAYSMGQIIKSVCVCQSVSLSVCQSVSVFVRLRALSRSHFSSIFTKISTDVKTPKMKKRVC